ncbi:hypothetical protein T4D_7856 [Trichinella pseudospiralis]|uniref:Uncharacterized protein n=1 Tax=Trichinella pseudospiralis TaxID=6337 RepID=A0A0V1F2W3_TRIPS|nr:hypothetical protein T4D_13276 [Trichinella pseudospiralis]KRY80493.1 hypothetical protein T4D_676 [Trichinella pseudospiralis]KRY80548.1 hypothetical protein T4D_7856 [Trichinella pseudospiralis]
MNLMTLSLQFPLKTLHHPGELDSRKCLRVVLKVSEIQMEQRQPRSIRMGEHYPFCKIVYPYLNSLSISNEDRLWRFYQAGNHRLQLY